MILRQLNIRPKLFRNGRHGQKKSGYSIKNPSWGRCIQPYQETDMSGASYYPWWALCVLLL